MFSNIYIFIVGTRIVAKAHLNQYDPIQQAQNNRFVREWVLSAKYNAKQVQT